MPESFDQYTKPPRFTEIKHNMSSSAKALSFFLFNVAALVGYWLLIYLWFDQIYLMFATRDWKAIGGIYLAGVFLYNAFVTAILVWLVKDE